MFRNLLYAMITPAFVITGTAIMYLSHEEPKQPEFPSSYCERCKPYKGPV